MEYQVMPDIREKEKIVGGLFTWTQTIFLALAVISGGVIALLTFQLLGNPIIALFTAAIGACPFLPFAFIKIEAMGKMELAKYLYIKYQYKHGQKIFVNLNENKRDRLREEIK